MKLKIAALSLVISTASILGACASPDEVQITPEESIPENSLSIPEPPEELSESTDIEVDYTTPEEPGITGDELPGVTIDETGNSEALTTPEGEINLEGEGLESLGETPEDGAESLPVEGESTETSN